MFCKFVQSFLRLFLRPYSLGIYILNGHIYNIFFFTLDTHLTKQMKISLFPLPKSFCNSLVVPLLYVNLYFSSRPGICFYSDSWFSVVRWCPCHSHWHSFSMLYES
ncbi:hypothetical protein GDO78_016487 [Eleutherodactylus coqui]|uniref:Uncharacterized protein n=1 Tax=Eleutherodactylus coqui TaxID=57060 RepID=A0A8J6EQS6_ELECQ|nr:hypothetical protein GDO78_016487 [Eleutherodactylus coqui]